MKMQIQVVTYVVVFEWSVHKFVIMFIGTIQSQDYPCNDHGC